MCLKLPFILKLHETSFNVTKRKIVNRISCGRSLIKSGPYYQQLLPMGKKRTLLVIKLHSLVKKGK